MAGETSPHFAFPLRFRGGSLVTVEEGSARHLQDQAEVLLRTRPGTLEATPDMGLRDLVARIGPASPVILDALAEHVDTRFVTVEDESLLAERIRSVAVELEEGTL